MIPSYIAFDVLLIIAPMERRNVLVALAGVYLAATFVRDAASVGATDNNRATAEASTHGVLSPSTAPLSSGIRAVDLDHPERELSVHLDGELVATPHTLNYQFCTA